MASNLNELLWRVGGHYDFSRKYMGAFGYLRVGTWPYEDNRFRSFYENWGKNDSTYRKSLGKRITKPK